MTELLTANLLNPIVLAFVLGFIAKLIRSELALPKDIYLGLSIYLLFSIGLQGGVELSHASFGELLLPVSVTIFLGCATPISAYLILRRIGKLSVSDSAAIAAHYGSVSAVTFIAAQNFVQHRQAMDPSLPPLEGFMPTLLTLLETPGIAVALSIGALRNRTGTKRISQVLHEVLTGRTMVLLLGGLIIGAVMGEQNWKSVSGFFDTKGAIFRGVLAIFLLEMGTLAAARISDLKKTGVFLASFAVAVPVLHGAVAATLGSLAGLSVGGCTVLAAMTASASYIAAPPAVRITLPDANPTYYLTTSLAITFPFNILLGIPLFFEIARLLS